MSFTEETHLPTIEELTVPEVNVSTCTLRAAAFHLGKHCEFQNNEFMLCRYELKDPRACLEEGKKVTGCTLDFFRLIKKNCLNEFNAYSNCLFKTSGDYAFEQCRKTQAVYDQCVLDKMNIERPDVGYYSRPHVHKTDRPRPPKEKKIVYEDATPGLPPDTPIPPAKHGSRVFWLYE